MLIFDTRRLCLVLSSSRGGVLQSVVEVGIKSVFITQSVVPDMITLRTYDAKAVPHGYLATYSISQWNKMEHDINCALAEDALAALLHDATEAYVGDMVRPLKRQMPQYQAAEDKVAWAIAEKFGISPVLPTSVKEADNRILVNERGRFLRFTQEVWETDALTPLPIMLQGWSPEWAEHLYHERLKELL